MKSNRPTVKLSIAFSVLIAILIGVGILGLGQMSRMNDETQQVTDVRWPKVKLAREALHYSDLNNRITMEVFLLDDKQQIAALLEQRARNTAQISAILKQIETQVGSNDEKASLARIGATRKPYIASYLKALDLLTKQGKPQEARGVMVNVTLPNLLAYHDAWEDFVKYQGEQMDADGDAVDAHYFLARRQVAGLVVLAVVLAGAIAALVTRRMTSEIADRQRAEGELRQAHEGLEVRVRERTAELQHASQKLMEASRLAGMAEIATSVLHNVGNVLNSVNVSATIVTEKLRQSEVASLAKVSKMLVQHGPHLANFLTEDSRGKLIPGFITELASCLGEEQLTMLAEVDNLSKGIEHIKRIVESQQTMAKTSSVHTPVNLSSLIEHAISMQSTLASNAVEIHRRCADGPDVMLDQHKVLQILINLLSNARHAVIYRPVGGRHVTLSVERLASPAPMLRFTVIDNGGGIAAENLTRIFSHGFTTKKEGHGFGLHSAANAAREMGGSLSATSEGPGKGATFTLEIPAIFVGEEEPCQS